MSAELLQNLRQGLELHKQRCELAKQADQAMLEQSISSSIGRKRLAQKHMVLSGINSQVDAMVVHKAQLLLKLQRPVASEAIVVHRDNQDDFCGLIDSMPLLCADHRHELLDAIRDMPTANHQLGPVTHVAQLVAQCREMHHVMSHTQQLLTDCTTDD
eukprot:c416_g1_i2.p1 GENE.c416_g1_i2~~c416_g1_i2.p1  ORF type:complete len:168 (-),score=57.69 c416_g1_i2:106-579(-)